MAKAKKSTQADRTPQSVPVSLYRGSFDPNYSPKLSSADLSLPGGPGAEEEGREVLRIWKELSDALRDPQDTSKWIEDAGTVEVINSKGEKIRPFEAYSHMTGREAYEAILANRAEELRKEAHTPEGRTWLEAMLRSGNPELKHKFNPGGASRKSEASKEYLEPITLDHPEFTGYLQHHFSKSEFFPPSYNPYFDEDKIHTGVRKAGQWLDWSTSVPKAVIAGSLMTPEERRDAFMGPMGDYPTISVADLMRRANPEWTEKHPLATEGLGLAGEMGLGLLTPSTAGAVLKGIIKSGSTRMAREAGKVPIEEILKRATTLAESRAAEQAIQQGVTDPEILAKSAPGFINWLKSHANAKDISNAASDVASFIYDPVPTTATKLARVKQRANLQLLGKEIDATRRGVSQVIAEGAKNPLQPKADLGVRMFERFYNTANSPRAYERAAQKIIDYTDRGYVPLSGTVAQMAHAAKLREEGLGTTIRRANEATAKVDPKMSTAEYAALEEEALGRTHPYPKVQEAMEEELKDPVEKLSRRLLDGAEARSIRNEIDTAATELYNAEINLQTAINSRSGPIQSQLEALRKARDAASAKLRGARRSAASYAQKLNNIDPEKMAEMQAEIPPEAWEKIMEETLRLDNAVAKTQKLADNSKAALQQFQQQIVQTADNAIKQGAMRQTQAQARSKAAQAVENAVMAKPEAPFTKVKNANDIIREDLANILQGKPSKKPSSDQKVLVGQANLLNKLEEEAVDQAIPGVNAGQGYKETKEAYGLNKQIRDFLYRGASDPSSIDPQQSRMVDSLGPLAARVAMGQTLPAHQATAATATHVLSPSWTLGKMGMFSTPTTSAVTKAGVRALDEIPSAVHRLLDPKTSWEYSTNRENIQAQRVRARMMREKIDPALIDLIIQNLPKE